MDMLMAIQMNLVCSSELLVATDLLAEAAPNLWFQSAALPRQP
ncbi:hypothetical protein BL107_05689 [Synechococcus sp. BL107]|jgi:hypothetical protein|nr:hypothetical protein BL107_05689 [Synechococcus sp. BL107]